MSETKTCPKCAEQIQRAATICRYCKTDVSTAGAVVGTVRNVGCVVAILALVSFCASISEQSSTERAEQERARAAIPDLPADVRAKCTRALQSSIDNRSLIELTGSTARVRATAWAELTRDQQRTFVAGIACSVYGRPVDALLDGQFVWVEDAATGDKLASASSGHVSVD